MRSRLNYPVQILTTGFLVLVFLSLSLFWASWICKSTLADIMPMEHRTVDIVPSSLVPGERENDPNIAVHSGVHAHIMQPEAQAALGIGAYIGSKIIENRDVHIWYLSPAGEDSAWIFFDKRSGQINCRWIDLETMPDGTHKRKSVQFYVGPEGVSEIPDKKLGRFSSLVADLSEGILYDRQLRRFFKINLKERTIIKGTQLSKDDPHKPVDIHILTKNSGVMGLYWQPPAIKKSQDDEGRVSYSPPPIIREGYSEYQPDRYKLVLDESGRIDLLDNQTLEFAGAAGYLPAPKTFFRSKERVTPDDLLAYRVLPVALKEDHEYRGMIAAAVSREGTALALAVFDEKGVLIKSQETKAKDGQGRRGVPSSTSVYFGAPWAPVMTIGKYLLENLHPPILSLASYFTASTFEAGSGHRALFLLPNSFIAMKGRDARQTVLERLLTAFLLMGPSVILALWLAWRVGKDAATVGFSRRARRWWMLGTIALGLAGYITYRLTRPKVALVTCANCGQPRRPDMDKCHRCGSPWNVPELIPPAWRVLDSQAAAG